MRAGKLRHLIEIQSPIPTRDAAGGVVKAWAPFATNVWADVSYLNGLEVVRADAPAALVRASILIRALPGVVASMRVLHDGKLFDIKAVLPDRTSRQFVYLACEQGLNNG
ncbi:head-tail adaptor protein [Variovorax sp. KBS0712]|uniref:phage head closure protein n=1 Tax=Variovorax sp. KBS0712 TaxID=2578111 RepID=UPI00111B180A|nr:phage head closure protein [Variovorax sp. KBS0712]TSD59026.1 head-tail adaptor protein [Variovorax sp. KBS0712]